MRLRNVPGSRDRIAESEFVVDEPHHEKGNWSRLFGNDHPLRIEIGTGKGQFLYTLAAQNPGINYVGIEKFSSVLLRVIQKMEEAPLPNLKLIRMDAEDLLGVFGKDEVDRIYLNFSDPWPKDRHAKRRLPSGRFLSRYEQFLKKDGLVEFKTDNRELFDFAVEEAGKSGWTILKLTYDLHHDPEMNEGNIMTEYEEKFSALGNPICKYIIVKEQP
ncbi:MAG: tRNA (guanosine(46)-N7)-methyltransferase TrmB [Lachnospiraceae bacterium]|nr:tRNA (guanosine(46)-N7)-methyltransferase TrmB [Lachnospiraceae bacterium]